MRYRVVTYPSFPSFRFYTHDIEDGLEACKSSKSLGEGDFIYYNLLLLWILPPLSSTTIQICVLLGLIIIIQIGLELTSQFAYLWEEHIMPGLLFPVILVSAYGVIVDCILQNLDVGQISNITLNEIE
jgi:hypothetical protein